MPENKLGWSNTQDRHLDWEFVDCLEESLEEDESAFVCAIQDHAPQIEQASPVSVRKGDVGKITTWEGPYDKTHDYEIVVQWGGSNAVYRGNGDADIPQLTFSHIAPKVYQDPAQKEFRYRKARKKS